MNGEVALGIDISVPNIAPLQVLFIRVQDSEQPAATTVGVKKSVWS